MSGLRKSKFVVSDSPNSRTQVAAMTYHDLEGILTLQKRFDTTPAYLQASVDVGRISNI